MPKDRIRELLGAYGADPSRWPPAERHVATLLESDAEVLQLAAEAGRLDALIGQHGSPALPAIDAGTLVERITATPQPRGYAVKRVAAEAGAAWRLSLGWRKIAGLASVALVGFVVGLTDLDGSVAQADGSVAQVDDEEAPAAMFGVFEESPW